MSENDPPHSSFRPATEADLLPILSALNRYANIYSANDSNGRSPSAFIDGRTQNIQDAGWLHYEGASAWFPQGMLATVLPWLVMNALVTNDSCVWIVADNSVAIQHPLVKAPITSEALSDGTWLNVYDYDEPPDEGEVALDSYDDLMALFARKRINGVLPVHGGSGNA